ncbi:hypothetical protein C5167_000681 [Papaver somniferum]|uniref:Uncharacterized protein n=1 Tax=Papaver somniferum TaxID=3469 RepID=A0A4Y7KT90_PAPSO|nr:hypothetical protein C5167_000681 [Papaver somniferum]
MLHSMKVWWCHGGARYCPELAEQSSTQENYGIDRVWKIRHNVAADLSGEADPLRKADKIEDLQFSVACYWMEMEALKRFRWQWYFLDSKQDNTWLVSRVPLRPVRHFCIVLIITIYMCRAVGFGEPIFNINSGKLQASLDRVGTFAEKETDDAMNITAKPSQRATWKRNNTIAVTP